MIILPEHITNNSNIDEIFLVTEKKCYKLNKNLKYIYLHPSISDLLTEYKISINYKNGETSEIVFSK